jgi:hypothetical protein
MQNLENLYHDWSITQDLTENYTLINNLANSVNGTIRYLRILVTQFSQQQTSFQSSNRHLQTQAVTGRRCFSIKR